MVIVNCIGCQSEFEKKENSRQKYCSRSCADKFRHGSPEQVYGRCANLKCNAIKNSHHVLCVKCTDEGRTRYKRYSYKLPDELTLNEAMKRTGANRYDTIRTWSRNKFIESGKEMKCESCGYDKHVEIAHIKSISSFSEKSMISEINSMSNLKALCPNCHWEFDHHFDKSK